MFLLLFFFFCLSNWLHTFINHKLNTICSVSFFILLVCVQISTLIHVAIICCPQATWSYTIFCVVVKSLCWMSSFMFNVAVGLLPFVNRKLLLFVALCLFFPHAVIYHVVVCPHSHIHHPCSNSNLFSQLHQFETHILLHPKVSLAKWLVCCCVFRFKLIVWLLVFFTIKLSPRSVCDVKRIKLK